MTTKTKTVFVYQPAGMDIFYDHTTFVPPGTEVVKCQPFGCPRNGTMGMAYVQNAVTGEFIGLRNLTSLQKKGKR